MKIESLLKGKDYFYNMHLSDGKNDRREELWNYAKDHNIIGLDHSFARGDWNDDSVVNGGQKFPIFGGIKIPT